MTQGSTRARVLHWFVRGGVARMPDGAEVAIDVDPLVIGREEGAQLRVADPEVSSVHCELRAVNEGVLVRDLGSTNGTRVNGLLVEDGLLRPGDELTIAYCLYRLVVRDGIAATGPPPAGAGSPPRPLSDRHRPTQPAETMEADDRG
jgi:hypothetical protein